MPRKKELRDYIFGLSGASDRLLGSSPEIGITSELETIRPQRRCCFASFFCFASSSK